MVHIRLFPEETEKFCKNLKNLKNFKNLKNQFRCIIIRRIKRLKVLTTEIKILLDEVQE